MHPLRSCLTGAALHVLLLIVAIPSAALCAPEDVNRRENAVTASLEELSSMLTGMHSRLSAVQEGVQASFEQQKTIAEKSGACISRLVELSQGADLSAVAEKERFKAVFLKSGDLLRKILSGSQTRADDLLEARLAQIQDRDAFFASPEWQQPQYLIFLSSYWLGWNNYYAALLFQPGEAPRAGLLEEAVSCFSRAVPDLKEQALAGRCIFGRALCFKEQKKYDRALQDIEVLMEKVPPGDLLHAQAGYERALIHHLSGESDLAVRLIQELQAEAGSGKMPQQLDVQLRQLQTNIALSIAEKKAPAAETGGAASYRDAIRELRRIAEGDATQSGVLYRYVFEHAGELAGMPEADLGSIGSMAVADWYFDRKEYEPAAGRYRRLYDASDCLISAYLDGLCFRLAYCHSRRQEWQEALACMETLFQKYPETSFEGRAACLYHTIAAQSYQQRPSEAAYASYIKAAECYVKYCPDEQDKNEARFQLGRYYQQRGRPEDARSHFTKISRDSNHYPEARQELLRMCASRLQADVEALESLIRAGEQQAERALKLNRDCLKQADHCQSYLTAEAAPGASGEMEAYVTLMLARLYTHGKEPSPHRALRLLKGFEGRFPGGQQPLYDMARRLRLECCLQLGLLTDAGEEVAGLNSSATLAAETWAFLNQCADRHYLLAKEAQTQAAGDAADRAAEASMLVYKSLAERAGEDAAYAGYYEPIALRLAELHSISRQWPQAAAVYEEIVRRDPASADALSGLAAAYEREERWEDAFAAWSSFSRGLSPGSGAWAEARLGMAAALIRLGKRKEACEVIAVTALRSPDLKEEPQERLFKLKHECCGQPNSGEAGAERP